jgi:hypothetical protein
MQIFLYFCSDFVNFRLKHTIIMSKHTWKYANIGGNTRVVITNGKDIQHLSELDEKLWAVLACPVSGLEIPDESLQHLDNNGDSKIHIADVMSAATWLCQVLRDPQVLFEGKAALALTDIADETLLAVATPLAKDNVVTLETVKAAIASATIDAQSAPDAPYTADVIAAYKACKDAYAAYYQTAKLQALGLATLPADAAAPGLTEEQLVEMGKQIADYEAGKAAVEAFFAGYALRPYCCFCV